MYKTAIIGCGNIAGGYDPHVPSTWSATHAGAYHLCKKTSLFAVADSDSIQLENFQKKWGIAKGYTDYREMIENEKIDILSICAPTDLHFDIFNRAIDAKIKALYLEKPLSNDIDEAIKMVELGEHTIVSVNYFRRWNTTLADIVSKVKKNAFGKGAFATVHYNKGLLLNGSHFIDLMCWMWGEPVSVEFIKTVVDDSVDPAVDFRLEFKENVTVYFLNVPTISYNFAQIDILFDKKRMTIGQRGQQLSTYPMIKEPHYQQFEILGAPDEIETDWRNCTTRAVEEITGAISNKTTVSCTLKDGLNVLQICQDILRQKQEQMRKT